MTIWERLFGTPETAAKTLRSAEFLMQDYCCMLDALSDDKEVRCRNCPFEQDRYGCEPKHASIVDWLNSEVIE